MILLNVDLSQAEARIVALLAKDTQLQDDFKNGVDIHSKTAAIIFGGKYEQYTKAAHNGEECDERFIGKTAGHAANYDMGKKRLMMEVNSSAKRFGIDLQISEYRASLALDKIHKARPNIRGVYHEFIKQRLTDGRTLINPFGRRRVFYERWDSNLFREAYAYIPQSTVHDQLVWAMLRIQSRFPRIQFLAESHDAFLSQINIEWLDELAPIIIEEMTRPIEFTDGIVSIPCDIEIGDNYKDLKKWAGRALIGV